MSVKDKLLKEKHHLDYFIDDVININDFWPG